MKSRLFVCILLLLYILSTSTMILSQDPIKERPDLKQEIIKASEIINFGENNENMDNVEFTVFEFGGTVEEALVYIEETLLKDESENMEMVYYQNNLSEILIGIRSLAEYGVISSLDEDWIEASKVEEEKVKGIMQTSYSGEIEYSDSAKDISVENPFYNPATFRLEEGTYIIYSESKTSG